MAKLSEAFDGWVMFLEPGTDFIVPSTRVLSRWDDDENEEGLLDFESPSPNPVLVDKPGSEHPAVPYRNEESAWGGIALALRSLCGILGGKAKAYQHNSYSADNKTYTPQYTFQFEPGSSGFQKGRL